MKKLVILMVVMAFIIVPSVVIADENGESKAGRLFLFQKCDESLDSPDGCPSIGSGPWPIFPDKNRWGKLDYSLWGDKFKFSFSGRGLPSDKEYTLIYYPDPWPGNGLICLGSGKTTHGWGKDHGKGGPDNQVNCKHKGGNLNIHGDVEIGNDEVGRSLPIKTDANFNPSGNSGAVGAKIWLVLTEDVLCENNPQMVSWHPTEYLFEYNLIVFEYRPDDDEDDD